MAGSGTAHLRSADEVLLQVTDLVVEFPVGKGRTASRRPQLSAMAGVTSISCSRKAFFTSSSQRSRTSV